MFLPQALAGVRVIDFSHVIAGPFASFHLAQMGADVVKVEKPGAGDVMRHGSETAARSFTAFNAGKQFRDIDIATDAGRDEVRALVRDADILLDNYRPGVLARHGLGHEAMRALNPRLIYCAISGYGYSSDAHRERGAYDHVVQAATGMAMMAGATNDPPIKTGFPVIDAATGIIGALAMVSALRERDREGGSGRGCFLDVSMWGASLQLMYPFACEALSTGQNPPRVGNQAYSGSPASDMFACADGWIAIGANTPAQIGKLVAALGTAAAALQSLLSDTGGGFARSSNPQQFKSLLGEALRNRCGADLERALNQAGVPAARVRTLAEFAQEAVDSGLLQPQTLGGDELAAVQTPGLGWQVRV